MPKASKPAAKPKSAQPKAKPAAADSDPKALDAHIQAVGGWRGQTLTRVRTLVRAALPDVVEDVKWRKASNNMLGVATWSHGGLLTTGESYKDKVKLTFAKGSALPDPKRLFNGNDTGATRRSIDLVEGAELDGKAFQALVKAAAKLNGG